MTPPAPDPAGRPRPAAPSLDELVKNLAGVRDLPADVAQDLLVRVMALQASLLARVATRTAGNHEHDQREMSATEWLLTLPQVAERLGVPSAYAYELGRRGVIPTLRVGKYVRVRLSALSDWLARQQQQNALDGGLGATLSYRRDRRGTPSSPQKARSHPGAASRTARRPPHQRQPVGARSDADSRGRSPADPADCEGRTT